MAHFRIPEDKWTAVCIQIDKMDKLTREAVHAELAILGVSDTTSGYFLDELQVAFLPLAVIYAFS
jgi:hypothetical protein